LNQRFENECGEVESWREKERKREETGPVKPYIPTGHLIPPSGGDVRPEGSDVTLATLSD